MKAVVTLMVCSALLISFTEANFYGKRTDGKSIKDLIQGMRVRAQLQGETASAEDVLNQIEALIRWYRASQLEKDTIA